MDYLLSIIWISFGAIGVLVNRIFIPEQMNRFPAKDEHKRILRTLLEYSIVCYSMSASLYNLPDLEDFSKSLLISLLVSIWLVRGLHGLFSLLPNASIKRSVYILLIGFTGLYANLVGWGQAPNPMDFPGWLKELPQYSKNLLAIPLGLLFSIFVYSIGYELLFAVTMRSKTSLDDDLAKISQFPLSITAFFIGVNYSVVHSSVSDFWIGGYRSFMLSILILVWTLAALRATSVLLEHMMKDESGWSLIQPRTQPIFTLLARLFIGVTAIYLMLLAWGINLMLWLTSAGIIGIAIAYASQDTLASLLSGVAILSDAPYKIGDFLILSDGQKGRVTSIGFRSTRLVTPNDIEVIIPNSVMANTQIINMSGGPNQFARIDCSAGVAYGSDIDEVRTILHDIGQNLKYVVTDIPKLTPQVHFISMGASSLDFVLRIWVTDPKYILSIQDEANTMIYNRFTEENIEIPYSKQDVYLYPMGQANGNSLSNSS